MVESATITRLEVQKKNKNRVSVFLDDEFAFGVDVSVLLKFNLAKGTHLAPEVIREIQEFEARRQTREQALRFLARRAHSEKELRLKLRQKKFTVKQIDRAIAELKQKKLLDDAAFALSFVRSRLLSRPMGARLLRQELWQKGISEENIELALQAAYADEDETEIARRLMEQRQSRYSDLEPMRRKKRLYDFLVRRGFSWEVAREVIENSHS